MSRCHGPLTVSVALIVVLGACLATDGQAAEKNLVVEAGEHSRLHVPMSVEHDGGHVAMVDADTGRRVPCQVAGGRLWWILERLDAGKARTYKIASAEAERVAAKVRLKQDDESIDIHIHGAPFTTYDAALVKSCGHQLRRPRFFPVYGPDQILMTRPFPLTDKLDIQQRKDHPHHTSLWVAYGNVNGVDNWSISGNAGWQVHKSFETVESGPVVGTFRETLDWTDKGKKPVMAEVRTVRVYAQPDSHRMLDLEVRLIAKYGDVKFGDTKEGGLCATRMRPEMRHDKKFGEKDGKLINANGETGKAAWGKKATWNDASGTCDGKRVGFAIFDHPDNLRHPTTWHARTYGLLTANPFGLRYFTRGKKRGDYTLEAGKELVFRYRVYFHRGDEQDAQVAARYADYATPPKATWK
ncbi:MAG: PmoA family protein [Planctomycetota bacterium]